MEAAWKFKVITLVLSLVGVLWGINQIKNGTTVNHLKSVGIVPINEATASDKPKKRAEKEKEKVIKATHDDAAKSENDDNHLSWCETRVKSLKTKNGIKIEQDGTTWYSMSPQKKAIDGLVMEKWLGRHCKLEIVDSRPPTFVPTPDTEMLEVGFINGESSKFTLTPEGYYFWDGLRFRSKQFKEALEQLAKVANGESL